MMDRPRSRTQVKLTVFENEPLARMAEQRLLQEAIPCVVRSLDAGPGGWGSASNLPHAIYVTAAEEMRARQVLDLAPAEIGEREGASPQPTYRVSLPVVVILIVTVAALIFGVLELVIERIIR